MVKTPSREVASWRVTSEQACAALASDALCHRLEGRRCSSGIFVHDETGEHVKDRS